MTSKIIIAGLVALAFVAGTMMTGIMADAAKGEPNGQPFQVLWDAIEELRGGTEDINIGIGELRSDLDAHLAADNDLDSTNEIQTLSGSGISCINETIIKLDISNYRISEDCKIDASVSVERTSEFGVEPVTYQVIVTNEGTETIDIISEGRISDGNRVGVMTGTTTNGDCVFFPTFAQSLRFRCTHEMVSPGEIIIIDTSASNLNAYPGMVALIGTTPLELPEFRSNNHDTS